MLVPGWFGLVTMDLLQNSGLDLSIAASPVRPSLLECMIPTASAPAHAVLGMVARTRAFVGIAVLFECCWNERSRSMRGT